jgi:hypothetical protein
MATPHRLRRTTMCRLLVFGLLAAGSSSACVTTRELRMPVPPQEAVQGTPGMPDNRSVVRPGQTVYVWIRHGAPLCAGAPTPACRVRCDVVAAHAVGAAAGANDDSPLLFCAGDFRIPALDIVRIERDAANWTAIAAGVAVFTALLLVF